MKKNILFGSLLVLTLLLLMPSIPAIQQKTIEDKAYSDLVEKLKEFNLENIDLKLPETYGDESRLDSIFDWILEYIIIIFLAVIYSIQGIIYYIIFGGDPPWE